MATRLIILDFDGTLADTRPVIVASMQRTLDALGLPPKSEKECATVIGLPLRECFTTLCHIDDMMGERCAELYRKIFDEINTPGFVKLFPHVPETLRVFHNRGLRMAICSSRGRPTLEGFVRSFRLEEMVEMVVSANDVQRHKPHPEPVHTILRALHVSPEETLVVGDASFDILMGRAAGCRTCGVTYGNQSAADLRAAGADFLVDDFANILKQF
ncbi:MAG: HAD family hydrolase [Bacteroidales bacterium]|nr:HAD family hydrolase [Bacteroidales bacterium]